jgi:glycosyltransferase involved in cell wall biosynthesis
MNLNNELFTYENNFKVNNEIESKLIFGDFKYNESPLVSIVIPTYKRPNLLKEAIDSALNQKGFNNYEVIVVDNEVINSTEKKTETEKLLFSYENSKIFYYKNEENIGMTGNWNRCIELARGELITILHDDDILYSNFLKEMMSNFNNTMDLLVSNVEFGLNYKSKNQYLNLNKKLKRIKIGNLIAGTISPAPGIIFRKNIALEIGGFKKEMYPCADYDFWSRFCLEYKGYFLNKKLAFYRMLDSESLKVSTRINIVKKAYMIKKNISKKSKLARIFDDLIISYSINGLINYYCESKNFKESKDLIELRKDICVNKQKKITNLLAKIILKLLRLI